MGNFQPLSEERAAEIRKAMAQARTEGKGLAFSETGECLGAASVKSSPDDPRNIIGQFDTHYGR